MIKINKFFSLLVIIGICASLSGCISKKAVANETSNSATSLADSAQSLNSENSVASSKVSSLASSTGNSTSSRTALPSDKNNGLKLDYSLNPVSFTRDYGETWIKADISAADLSETLKTYQSQHEIPNGSYYISEKPDGIIAFFYGGKPMLSITKDNGKTWEKKLFKFNYADIQKPITHRFVGFTSNTEGYVGLGTDWSMGTGESEFCYLTHDGGTTWENKELPRTDTSMLLDGMAFCDSKCGVVTYNKAYSLEEVMPTFYYTNNGGNSWAEFTVPSTKAISDFSFQKADSLVFVNGTYTLTLGQTGRGNKKVSFTSTNLKNWTFQKTWTSAVHSIG